MKMLDLTTDKSIKTLTLLLQETEARQLLGYLEMLLTEAGQNEHHHLNNEDYSKEITVALYDENNIESFSDRVKTLIQDDK